MPQMPADLPLEQRARFPAAKQLRVALDQVRRELNDDADSPDIALVAMRQDIDVFVGRSDGRVDSTRRDAVRPI